MGVFDALHEGPATAETLAARLGAQPAALARLLDGCAALQLLHKRDGVYENAPVAETYLYSAQPAFDERLRSLLRSGALSHVGQSRRRGARGHAALVAELRPGRADLQRLLPHSGGDARFSDGHARLRHAHLSRHRPAAFDLSRFRRLVDLGGATGHLTIAACERYPELRGVVFDLPQAGAIARELVARSTAAARIEVVSGDFFVDELPEADLYYVGRILHDWSEEKIDRLLARSHSAPALRRRAPDRREAAGRGWRRARWPPTCNRSTCWWSPRAASAASASIADLLIRAGFHNVDGRRTGVALDAVIAFKA